MCNIQMLAIKGGEMKSILLLIILMISGNCLAADQGTQAGKITRIHYWEGIDGMLIMHSNPAAETNCPSNAQYVLSKSNPYFDAIYSLLLAAAASKADVILTVSDSQCLGNYPYIKNVYYNP